MTTITTTKRRKDGSILGEWKTEIAQKDSPRDYGCPRPWRVAIYLKESGSWFCVDTADAKTSCGAEMFATRRINKQAQVLATRKEVANV